MKWWGKLSHGQQVAVFVPAAWMVAILGFRGTGDSWGEAVIEGIGVVVLGVATAVVIRRQRQGSEKYRD